MGGANIDREKIAFIELANRGAGLTPIIYIYSENISAGEIRTQTFRSAFGELLEIISNNISTDTIAASGRAALGSLKVDDLVINNNSIYSTATTPQIFAKSPLLLSPTTTSTDTLSFLPQTGVKAVYTWPNPPSSSFTSIYVLNSDPSGILRWQSQLIRTVQSNSTTLEYITSDSNGNLNFTSVIIPMSLPNQTQKVTVKNYLTSDTNGTLSFTTTTITILPAVAIKKQQEEKTLIIDGKSYSVPPFNIEI